MTIGEGIANGGHNYAQRMEQRRQFDASLAERSRAADQSAFVSMANAPRVSRLGNDDEKLAEQRRQFDATLDEKRRQFDVSNSWSDALNKQAEELNAIKIKESQERLGKLQRLEEEARTAASEKKNAMHTAVRDLMSVSYNNGGWVGSQEVYADIAKRLGVAGISNAGFMYNQDGSVKSPKNDDGKEPAFGFSFVAVNPQTRQQEEHVFVPKNQKQMLEDIRNSFGLSGSGGSGLEIAKINADQKEKDREARQKKQEADNAFREKNLQYKVSKDLSKEARDFMSGMSDEERKSFLENHSQLAKIILGMSEENPDKAPIKPGDNNGVEQSKYGTAQKDGEYWVRTTKDGRKFRIKNGDDPNVRSNWSQF